MQHTVIGDKGGGFQHLHAQILIATCIYMDMNVHAKAMSPVEANAFS